MTVPTRHVGNVFRRTAGFQIPALIRKAHNGVRVSDVDPLRVWPWRIKVDAERPVQTAGESLSLLGLALGRDSPEDPDIPRVAFRDEKVTIGRSADQAWI